MNGIYRVLKQSGPLILNIGDKYYCNSGRHRCNIKKYRRETNKHLARIPQLKEVDNYRQWKQLLLLPHRIAIKMQEGKWILKNEYLWIKPNGNPNYAQDRSSPSTERIYFFVKSKKYYFDTDLARKLLPTDVILCNVESFKKHQSSFSEKLIELFIRCFSKPNHIILDPFSGSGTVLYVAKKYNRKFIGIDLSKESCQLSRERVTVSL